MSTGVSLYVPCYNAGRYIEKCLEGVFNQSRIPDEVIIVDDGSTDDTSEVAKRFPVKLVSHECNKGLAAARNTGVRCAKHELVASIDADCIPKHDWLERLLSCMTSADVAGSGGRLVETNTRALPDRWRTTAHDPAPRAESDRSLRFPVRSQHLVSQRSLRTGRPIQ